MVPGINDPFDGVRYELMEEMDFERTKYVLKQTSRLSDDGSESYKMCHCFLWWWQTHAMCVSTIALYSKSVFEASRRPILGNFSTIVHPLNGKLRAL